MRYLITLFISVSCIGTTLLSMDEGEKSVDLTWMFAQLSILDKAAPSEIKIIGSNPEIQTVQSKAQLKKALFSAFQSVSLEYPSEASTVSTPCINISKLSALINVLEELKREEQQLIQKEVKEQHLVELIKKHHAARTEANKLEETLIFLPGELYLCIDIKDVEQRLHSLQQKASKLDQELYQIDREGKRFDQAFLTQWNLHLHY